ncbi:hypothetical protein AMECASPLE_034679, partial [Ameca splendens]
SVLDTAQVPLKNLPAFAFSCQEFEFGYSIKLRWQQPDSITSASSERTLPTLQRAAPLDYITRLTKLTRPGTLSPPVSHPHLQLRGVPVPDHAFHDPVIK